MIGRPDAAKGSEAPGGRTNLRKARPMPRAGQDFEDRSRDPSAFLESAFTRLMPRRLRLKRVTFWTDP
jgi:hypothetical protein